LSAGGAHALRIVSQNVTDGQHVRAEFFYEARYNFDLDFYLTPIWSDDQSLMKK
jgi:hypothetical protein